MHDGATLETIVRSLMHEYLWFQDNRREIRTIEKLIDKMHHWGLLVSIREKKTETFKIGIEVEAGFRLVDLVRGYDPFEYQIMELISGKGTVSNNEIHSHIIEGLKWTKNDKVIEDYLYRLRKRKHITKTANYYRFRSALEPISKTSKRSPVDYEVRRKDTLE